MALGCEHTHTHTHQGLPAMSLRFLPASPAVPARIRSGAALLLGPFDPDISPSPLLPAGLVVPLLCSEFCARLFAWSERSSSTASAGPAKPRLPGHMLFIDLQLLC